MFNLSAFAKGNKSMTRQEIADKNLEILFKYIKKHIDIINFDFENKILDINKNLNENNLVE